MFKSMLKSHSFVENLPKKTWVLHDSLAGPLELSRIVLQTSNLAQTTMNENVFPIKNWTNSFKTVSLPKGNIFNPRFLEG